MKTFSTSGTGSEQTLSEIESDKIPIYNSVADAEADLTNLKEGQIIAIITIGAERLAYVVNENGTKKIKDLTANTGTGAPVGTFIAQYKKVPMSGYLYCDGSTFDETAYPALYLYLGTNVLPDYRECVMVGAEQNTTDTIAEHDVYTQGEFKDDQFQFHKHNVAVDGNINYQLGASRDWDQTMYNSFTLISGTKSIPVRTSDMVSDVTYRNGTVTHGKQKAVYVYIKATSGLAENQQENVLNAIKSYVSPSLVYSATGIEAYRQAGTYTFQFRGCSLTDYQTAINAVLNGQTLTNPWPAFVSRRDSGNNNIFPGTIVVSTDLYVTGWYSNGSGVESVMNMSDTLYGNATIVVTD